MPRKQSMFSEPKGAINFHGAGDSRHDPGYGYMRLKKEGIGVWFKGRVTEEFPPEDGGSKLPWEIINLMGIGEPNAQGQYSSYSFRVYPGTINNILPENTFSSDGLVKFTIQANQLLYLFLDVATDGTKVTMATLRVASALPSDASPVGEGVAPSKFVVPLGIVQNNSPLALRNAALTATPVVAGSKPKAPSRPNEEPFVRLWMWKV